jgi:hypothetical protein
VCSGDAIRRFRDELLTVIDMDPFGGPFIERFALDNPVAAGYTLIQAITTSSITAHFSEYLRWVYLDVFSCRAFDAKAVAEFAARFSSAIDHRVAVPVRR